MKTTRKHPVNPYEENTVGYWLFKIADSKIRNKALKHAKECDNLLLFAWDTYKAIYIGFIWEDHEGYEFWNNIRTNVIKLRTTVPPNYPIGQFKKRQLFIRECRKHWKFIRDCSDSSKTGPAMAFMKRHQQYLPKELQNWLNAGFDKADKAMIELFKKG